MRRRTRAALGVLGCALLACCALSAPALLLGMDAGQTALCCAYLCLCVAITHALCACTRALWQYVPACALTCAAAALLPVCLPLRIASGALCAVLCVWRLYGRAAGKPVLPDTPAYPALAVFVIACVAGAALQDERVVRLSCALCVPYALTAMAFRAQENLGAFLSRYGMIARLPERRVRAGARGMLIACCALAALCMALMALSGAERIAYLAGGLLLSCLRFLVSLLPSGGDAPQEPSLDTPGGGMGGLPAVEAAEPSAFWLLMQQVLRVLTIGALAAGAVALTVYCIYRLSRRFGEGGAQAGDRAEFIAPPTREERLRRARAKGVDVALPFTPEGAVRRAFVAEVRSRTRARPGPALTPQEIEDFAGMEPGEARSALHELYARARYGGGVTREEARALRMTLKRRAAARSARK